MNAQRKSIWGVIALVIAGISFIGLHYSERRRQEAIRTDSLWRLRYEVAFEAERSRALLRVAIPADTSRVRVFRQDLRGPRLEIDRENTIEVATRFVTVKAPRPGDYRFDFGFDLYMHEAGLAVQSKAIAEASAIDHLPDLLRKRLATPPNVISCLADELASGSARLSNEQLTRRFFEYCHAEYLHRDDVTEDELDELFRRRTPENAKRAGVLVLLCQAAGIPAHTVTGFLVRTASRADPRIWVEVRPIDGWIVCDVERGLWDAQPGNYLPLCRGATRIIQGRNVEEVDSEFSMSMLPEPPDLISTNDAAITSILDLTRLPLPMHQVLSIILLMPLGALVTCIFRNIFGIETSGRFTPMLLALSFIFADWHTGLLVFTIVILLGLVTRTCVEPLKLLMLPRLSIILTLVVWCLVFGVSALVHYGVTPGAHAVLLPMVILTMVVERFYVSTQEDGVSVALRRLAGTILVGCVCYLVLRWEFVAQLLFAYPEAHLLTLAALIALGRYTGYRLTELWRFRDMADGTG